jgi:hypothetical protein
MDNELPMEQPYTKPCPYNGMMPVSPISMPMMGMYGMSQCPMMQGMPGRCPILRCAFMMQQNPMMVNPMYPMPNRGNMPGQMYPMPPQEQMPIGQPPHHMPPEQSYIGQG